MIKKICFFVFIFFLMACTKHKKQDDVNVKIDTLDTKVSSLQEQIKQLQEKVDIGYQLISANQTAMFTPSSKGYSSILTKRGSLFVSLDSLKKYANGYKVIFLIGNPRNVIFNNAKLSVRWGKPYSSQNHYTSFAQPYSRENNYANWYLNLQYQEIEINKPLLPGVWNRVAVILSPASADEVGVIMLSLTVDNIVLGPDLRKNED